MNSPVTKLLAAFLVLLSLAKLAALLVDARAWVGLVRRVCADAMAASAGALAAAGAVLFLLVRSGLDIVQILAACLFAFLLAAAGVAPHAPRLCAWAEAQDMRRLLRRQWLYVAAWTALLLWGAYALLFSP